MFQIKTPTERWPTRLGTGFKWSNVPVKKEYSSKCTHEYTTAKVDPPPPFMRVIILIPFWPVGSLGKLPSLPKLNLIILFLGSLPCYTTWDKYYGTSIRRRSLRETYLGTLKRIHSCGITLGPTLATIRNGLLIVLCEYAFFNFKSNRTNPLF